ncbi:MAG: DNA repair protein RecO [Roseburia sp.]
MGNNVTVVGMILSAMPMSEFDKRVTILTLDRGKIAAFAKGARRQNSPLLAASNPFVFGEFTLYEGRSSYNLLSASVTNYFSELTSELADTYYGLFFLEMAEYFTQENNDEKLVLSLLYQSLRALESSKFDRRLVKVIYEWKMLMLNGIYPNMFSCQCCGKKENLYGFSVRRAGMICRECSAGEYVKPLHPSTLYTMQYIMATEITKLFRFSVTDQVLQELEELLRSYRGQYVNHMFKSEKFLEDGLLQ